MNRTWDSLWLRYGRAYAWLGALLFVVWVIFIVLAETDVIAQAPPCLCSTGPPESVTFALVGSGAYYRQTFATIVSTQWLDYLTIFTYTLGFLALIPLGLALRSVFGRADARPQLMSVSYSIAALLAGFAAVIDIVMLQVVSDFNGTSHIDETWISVGITHYLLSRIANGFRVAALFFLAFASIRAAQAILSTGIFHRAVAYLNYVVAALVAAAAIVNIIDGGSTLFVVLLDLGLGLALPAFLVWVGLRLRAVGEPAVATG